MLHLFLANVKQECEPCPRSRPPGLDAQVGKWRKILQEDLVLSSRIKSET